MIISVWCRTCWMGCIESRRIYDIDTDTSTPQILHTQLPSFLTLLAPVWFDKSNVIILTSFMNFVLDLFKCGLHGTCFVWMFCSLHYVTFALYRFLFFIFIVWNKLPFFHEENVKCHNVVNHACIQSVKFFSVFKLNHLFLYKEK